MRVDLPLPDTPVTQTKRPSGMSTVTLRRLCSRAPSKRKRRGPGVRRRSGTGITRRPERNAPVIDGSHSSSPFRSPA
jgi:hypothetical protein